MTKGSGLSTQTGLKRKNHSRGFLITDTIPYARPLLVLLHSRQPYRAVDLQEILMMTVHPSRQKLFQYFFILSFSHFIFRAKSQCSLVKIFPKI
jgi:CHASE3 domain sensor protein